MSVEGFPILAELPVASGVSYEQSDISYIVQVSPILPSSFFILPDLVLWTLHPKNWTSVSAPKQHLLALANNLFSLSIVGLVLCAANALLLCNYT
jgi:hypothetical protein